jgi:hypothetical protein
MILFIAVAAALFVLYSKPHLVPGHRYQIEKRAVPASGAVVEPGPEDVRRAAAAQPTQAETGSPAEDRTAENS